MDKVVGFTPVGDNTFLVQNLENSIAIVTSQESKLKRSIKTNHSAVHLNVGGNCFNQLKENNNAKYNKNSGSCFETQNYPDAPNQEHFPSALLKKGAVYNHTTIYKFEKQ